MSKNRVRSSRVKKAPPTARKTGWEVAPYLHAFEGSFISDLDLDIPRGQWASVLAYKTDSAVNRAAGLVADAVDSMRWRIMRDADGKDTEVSSSDDRRPQHPMAQAVHDVFVEQGQPLLSLIALSTQLYGATYIAKTTNEYGQRRGLRYLNPYWTTPQITGGTIQWFQYGGVNGQAYTLIAPEYVAYSHTYNPDDDLRGYSKVDAAIDSINRNRYARQFVKFAYQNNARPGGVVAPQSNQAGDTVLSPQEVDDITRVLRDNHQGTRNANNMLILPRPLTVTLLEQPEIDKYYSIVPITEKEIFRTFGVPLAMAGDSSGSTYKDGDEVLSAFYKNTIIPLCRVIAKYINAFLMPWLDPLGDCTFEFDTSPYEDTATTDKALADMWAVRLSGSYVYLNEARLAQGLDARPEFEGFVLVSGVPTPIARLGAVPDTIMPQQAPTQISTPDTPLLTDGKMDHEHAHTHEPVEAYVFEKGLPVAEWREKALNELRAWVKRDKAGKAFGFQPIYTADILRSFEGETWDVISVRTRQEWFDYAFAVVRHEPFKVTLARLEHAFSRKDFGSTRREFEDEFLLAIADAKDGSVSLSQLSSILHSVVDTLGEQAYFDGLEDGGVSNAELDEDDRATIANLKSEASGYIDDFIAAFDSKTDIQLDQTPLLWSNKTLQTFYDRGLQAADINGVYIWRIGNTELHCRTCLAMEGQRKRMKTWLKNGILPKSKALECGGWLCDCGLFNVRGNARGQS